MQDRLKPDAEKTDAQETSRPARIN